MIVIIGAGITGLVLGHYLQKAGKDFRILEASQRSGGNMQTQQIGPYLLEAGPNSLIMNDAFFALLQELNLEKEIQYADPQAKNRYVLRGGQYKKLPAGPPSLIFSKTFSLQAKRQILGERHKKAQHIPDESVDHFFRRRLGDEITDYAVYPFISGIYAGDPKQLLIAEAFPQLTEWEKDFGSILKGFIKGRTPQQHKGTFSFKNGLKSLTERLATRLKPKILYGQRVSQIDCQSDGSFRLKIQDAQAPELIKQPIRQLVSTIPAHQLSPMIASLDPSFAQQLLHIPYPAVNVVATAYQKPQIDHPLDGFGALHNQLESSETLGTIFTSSIFPNRAPSDQHLLTTFIGGSLHPDKGMAPDEALKEMVRVDHKRFLGMRGQPVFQHVFRWEKAIPQYTQCIPAIRPLVEKWEKQRLFVGGNWWGGIAVSSCLKRAHELAEILCG